uniref:Uncharacterized protein n=1 Tax=Leuconostoc citreum TaxID=33964 RepID=A0A098DN33_LEUCI|nr:Protein of unknown function [Leuconostoc citreum]
MSLHKVLFLANFTKSSILDQFASVCGKS